MVTLTSETTTEEATATATTGEFQYIPLELIIIEKQIRTGANVDGEDSQGLVDSVAAKGASSPSS